MLNNWRAYFQNLINSLLVLLRKTGFFDRIYTCLLEKQNLEEKKKYLRELSGFHSVTSSNVILYNDVKNFHQKWIYQVLEINSSILDYYVCILQSIIRIMLLHYIALSELPTVTKKSYLLRKSEGNTTIRKRIQKIRIHETQEKKRKKNQQQKIETSLNPYTQCSACNTRGRMLMEWIRTSATYTSAELKSVRACEPP